MNLWLNPSTFTLNLLYCIAIALLVLSITYALLNFSRLIINFFENRVTPQVYKIFGPGKVVTLEFYETVTRDRDALIVKFENERELRIKLQNEITTLENSNAKLSTEVNENKIKSKTISDLESIIESLKNNSIESEKYENMVDKIMQLIKENESLKKDFDRVERESKFRRGA